MVAAARWLRAKGNTAGLAENREGLQPERAGGVQLVERRANGVEPAYVDNLDQKLAGHVYVSRSSRVAGSASSSR